MREINFSFQRMRREHYIFTDLWVSLWSAIFACLFLQH